MPLQPPSITRLILHCSASPNGRDDRAADIDRWHRERGFRRDPALIQHDNPTLRHIGYHYVIDVSGVVETGRSEREVGAHCQGYNAGSLGICLIGTDRYTAAQWQSLRDMLLGSRDRPDKPAPAGLLARHGLQPAAVHGHREFNPHKTCPGFDVRAFVAGGFEPLPDHLLLRADP